MDRFYGKQSTFLIWRISLHILCALSVALYLGGGRGVGVGVVDRAGKSQMRLFRAQIAYEYGYERSTVTLWKGGGGLPSHIPYLVLFILVLFDICALWTIIYTYSHDPLKLSYLVG